MGSPNQTVQLNNMNLHSNRHGSPLPQIREISRPTVLPSSGHLRDRRLTRRAADRTGVHPHGSTCCFWNEKKYVLPKKAQIL